MSTWSVPPAVPFRPKLERSMWRFGDGSSVLGTWAAAAAKAMLSSGTGLSMMALIERPDGGMAEGSVWLRHTDPGELLASYSAKPIAPVPGGTNGLVRSTWPSVLASGPVGLVH